MSIGRMLNDNEPPPSQEEQEQAAGLVKWPCKQPDGSAGHGFAYTGPTADGDRRRLRDRREKHRTAQ